MSRYTLSNSLLALASLLIVAACGEQEAPASHAASEPMAVESAGSDAPATLAADIEEIMTWWNGDYDNARQVEALRAAGKPIWGADDSGEGGHIEVTSHYRPVDLPAFGEHVIYVEETKHGDPNNLFRQRIYTLAIDESIDAIRVTLWNFKDKEAYRGAWRDLDLIADLSPDELSPLPDTCDLIVSKVDGGAAYHMPMKDRDCAFGDRYFNYQVRLGADSFWFRDKIVLLENDEIVAAAGDFTYHELDRLPR